MATYYDSEMTDAPLFNATNGSLINVLDAVLINGFGSMPPLGWQKVFQNTANTIAVYRNIAGSGRYYQVVDDGKNTTKYSGYATVACYESMTDYATGTLRVGATFGKNSYCSSSYKTNSSKIRWKIIGDAKGFYFLNPVYHDNYGSWYQYEYHYPKYFGDYIPMKMDDRWNSCMFTDWLDGSTFKNSFNVASASLQSVTNTTGKRTHYSANYEPNSVSCSLITGVLNGSYNVCNADFYSSDSVRGLAGPLNGTHFAGRPIIVDSQNNIRGHLPGLLAFNVGRSYLGWANNSKLVYVDGKKEIHVIQTSFGDYFGSSTSVNYRCYVFIDSGEGFRP